jgi:hypothetical protein
MRPVEFISTRGAAGKYLYFGTNGQINFSPDARTFLSLKEGESVKLFRDREKEKAWYLSLQNGGGYPIKTKNDGRTAYFSSSAAVREVRAMFPFKKGGSARLWLGDPKPYNGETYYPLQFKN